MSWNLWVPNQLGKQQSECFNLSWQKQNKTWSGTQWLGTCNGWLRCLCAQQCLNGILTWKLLKYDYRYPECAVNLGHRAHSSEVQACPVGLWNVELEQVVEIVSILSQSLVDATMCRSSECQDCKPFHRSEKSYCKKLVSRKPTL